MRIMQLLTEYKKTRDEKINKLGEHSIIPPNKFCKSIKTLDIDFFRPLSPMLKRRFDFCSSWKNAYLDQSWLSVQEINSWEENEKIREWISLRKENSYAGEPLADLPGKDIAIFSIDPHEPGEIYLVWSKNSIEPKIWHYIESDFFTYNNFERFLLYINGRIGDEDTIRKYI